MVAHAAMLAVRFVAPAPAPVKPTDPGLEVILVNAKHSKAPLKAEALAQANLDGGGNVDKGRSKSPLPDMRKTEDGESIKASKRRIAELEERQRNLLTRVAKPDPFNAPPVTEKTAPDPLPSGADLLDSSKAIARRAAEISETIEDQNKRPKKTFITPSTRGVGYAMYYKSLQKRIEDIGTLNFPQENGRSCTANWCCRSRFSRTARSTRRKAASRSTAAPATPRWTTPPSTSCAARRRSASSRRTCCRPTRTICG